MRFGRHLGSILGADMGPYKRGGVIQNRLFFCMLFLCCFASPSRRPKRRPRGSKTPPRAPQEAPRGSEERPRRLQEDLKRPQEPVKRAQDSPRSPQEAPKRHRRCIRWPKSMYPKGLAPNRRTKKGGRAAVMPLGASQSAARPAGARSRRVGSPVAVAEFAKLPRSYQ